MNNQASQLESMQTLRQVMLFLQQHDLVADPINYAVVYHYFAEPETELAAHLQQMLDQQRKLDSFALQALHQRWLSQPLALSEQATATGEQLINGLNQSAQQTSHATTDYLSQLNSTAEQMQSLQQSEQQPNIELAQLLVADLQGATKQMLQQQQVLQQQLQRAQRQGRQLKQQLTQLTELTTRDQLTGLENEWVLADYMSDWLQQQPQPAIAAIMLDIDHFSDFNAKYGQMVGDVILTKIAAKIRQYVAESGLPIRFGGEEFLVLLPGVSLTVANEVAEQIRQGVAKMKLVSARSKRSLPSVTVSLGTASYRSEEPVQQLVERVTLALSHAKATGRNTVSSELIFN